MNHNFSKYLFYYPVTLLKGENVSKYLRLYRKYQYEQREAIEAYQLESLNKLIRHARSHSEYYKESFSKLGCSYNSVNSMEDLKNIPTLSKSDLANKAKLIESKKISFFCSTKTTGGSTGQAVTLMKNPGALARERAATWRAYEWAGISIGDPQARFWGTPLHQTQRLKSRLIDLAANRVRFSAFEIDDNRFYEYYQKIKKFKPAYLYGYVSFIELFAKYLAAKEYDLPLSVRCVITTSEVLTEDVRGFIEDVLKLKVFNEYGCGEVGSIAHECEHGSLHIMDENLIVEIDGNEAEEGEIIVTDLHNYVTPIIRYRLGDYASFSSDECPCGRGLKILKGIHGRAYDCIHTIEGYSFHPELIMYIFEDIKEKVGGVSQFQVIQESLNHIRVKIVKEINYSDKLEKFIRYEFKKRISESMNITIEYVETIPREASGKMRLIKSNISAQD